jgi:hypothetical protein
VQLTLGTSIGLGGMAISADNKLVSVAAGAATYTIGFTAGSGNNGSVSPFGTPYHANAVGTAVSVAFDPSTRFLYIGETGVFNSTTNSGAVRMIAVTYDVPGNEAATSPYASGGTGPHSILAATNGYVYVANWVGTSAGNVTGFLVDASTPKLKAQSNPVATGTEPYGIAEDSKASYVMTVSNQGNPYFNAFTFDATTTGQLDSAGTGSTGTGPLAIVAVP